MVVLGMVYENYWVKQFNTFEIRLLSCLLHVVGPPIWILAQKLCYAVLKKTKGERIGGLTSSMMGCSSTY